MFGSSYKIATVWGIPIKIHMSLLILLGIYVFTSLSGGIATVVLVLMVVLGVFASIALHELGHSFVALRKGCRVREITLLFMGGAAQMDRMPSKPQDELQMALAGPAVSLVLGFTGYYGGIWLINSGLLYLGSAILLVGKINFFLACFNLLPSFPMDGGRVCRAMLTRRMGRLRATFVAARLGKIFSILFGLYGFMTGRWILVAIAFFIFSAAGSEYRMVQMEEAAKQGGFGGWSPFGGPPPDPDDEVIISPPPYEKGPGSRSSVQSSDDNPLSRLFKR